MLFLVGLALGATPAPSAAVFPPLVLIDASQLEVPPPWLAAFSRILAAESNALFRERRWTLPKPGAVQLALDAFPPALTRPARDASVERSAGPAHRAAATKLGLSRWISPRIERDLESCSVAVFLMAAERDRPERSFRRRLAPCSLDGLVAAAHAAPGALLEGPRHPWPVATQLTQAPLPDLHVRSLPDVPGVGVGTSTVPQPLGEALLQYRRRAVLVFEDEDGVLRFARDQELLGECGLRRAVAAPISDATHTFCHGNDWVWAFLGVPVGGFLAWISYPDFEQGNLHGFVGFSAGILGAVTSATLAAAQMRFGTRPDEGRYRASELELKGLARRGNTRLRAELGLSEAEAQLALESLLGPE